MPHRPDCPAPRLPARALPGAAPRLTRHGPALLIALAALAAAALPGTGLRAAAPPAVQEEGLVGLPVPQEDAAEARRVIRAQLDAFAEDNAEAAFSYASPGIRQQFGDAERFLLSVQEAYPVVHRPASVSFLKPLLVGAELVQQVRMSDTSGAVWMAVYTLQRQPDRSWRIHGCQLIRSPGTMV